MDAFSTTNWSLVVCAGAKGTSARSALETLCRRYWFPLYAFVRREGYTEHDAQDLTQAFFAQFLAKDYFHGIDRSRGKFRSFLLACMRHFLANARDFTRAAKRGGGRISLPLDFSYAEDRYLREPIGHWTPEKLYDRRWALEILHAVVERLESEWAEESRREFFLAVRDFVGGGEPTRTYAEIGTQFAMTAGAVKTAVYRLRRRYRELLREEIAHTVSDPAEVDDELRQLFTALAGS
jgi:RNA polymerase sigma-70 factor (ECF subfamily)